MKFITKQPDLPKLFNKWVSDNQDKVNSKTFESLPQDAKDSLQKALIKEQGHICCFCGSRIYRENTEIAHFIPQKEEVAEKVWQTNQEVIFDYNNLFASCNGSADHVKYQIMESKLASEIINDFDITEIYYDLGEQLLPITSIDNLIKIYYKDANQKNQKYKIWEKVDSFESLTLKYGVLYTKKLFKQWISPDTLLHAGKKVIINEKLDKQQIHCNNAQENQRLHFSFFNQQLENDFYFKISGEIDSNDAELQQDIETLNLNSVYLCGQRKRIVNLIEQMYEEGFFDDEQAKLNFLEDYCKLQNNKFRPFVFVYATEFRRLLV
jgi:uncharacterized protein (TIGR02646 family)